MSPAPIHPVSDPASELADRIKSLRQHAAADSEAAAALGNLLSVHPYLAMQNEISNCYELCAEVGMPEASAGLASLALRNDPKSTAAWTIWSALAEQGFAHGLLQAGYCLRWGIGRKANPDEGLSYYLRAAAQGNTLAFALLADLYHTGDGAPHNTEVAKAWQQLASLRQYPGLTAPSSSTLTDLAAAIKQNIQSLGGRIGRLEISPNDPNYGKVFNEQVMAHFAQLSRPEIAATSLHRSPAAGQPETAKPETDVICWQPRLIYANCFATYEDCCHVLSARPELDTDDTKIGDEWPISLGVMTPATHMTMMSLSRLLHLPWQHFGAPALVSTTSRRTLEDEGLSQADRLAKNRLGDHSGRRIATAWLALATPSDGGNLAITIKETGRVRSRPMRTGDLACVYHLQPDRSRTRPGASIQYSSEGGTWLLRIHAYERPVITEGPPS